MWPIAPDIGLTVAVVAALAVATACARARDRATRREVADLKNVVGPLLCDMRRLADGFRGLRAAARNADPIGRINAARLEARVADLYTRLARVSRETDRIWTALGAGPPPPSEAVAWPPIAEQDESCEGR